MSSHFCMGTTSICYMYNVCVPDVWMYRPDYLIQFSGTERIRWQAGLLPAGQLMKAAYNAVQLLS